MIAVRQMRGSDALQAAAIEQQCFSRPWSRESLEKAADDANALYLAAEHVESGSVVGYMGAYLILDEAAVNQIAVDAAWRRQGIGTLILQEFMQRAAERGMHAVTLEVRQSNRTAIALYEKCGFVIEGVRKNFYEAPKEDACIMWNRFVKN